MSMNKRNFVAAGMGLAGLWTATGSSHAATQAKAPSPSPTAARWTPPSTR